MYIRSWTIIAIFWIAWSPLCSSLSREGLVLLNFSNNFPPSRHGAFRRWNESHETPCSWPGIVCYQGHVKIVNLTHQLLTGRLGPELAHIPTIQMLLLAGNNFNGSIPKELGNMKDLTILDLSHNRFRGSIPPDIGNASNLTKLFLNSNNLHGNIPSELGKLHKLRELRLDRNSLSGYFPGALNGSLNEALQLESPSDAHATWDKGVCKFKNLIVGNFGFNYLTGPLPSCFSSSSLNFQWNCFDTNSWRQRPPEQCSHVEGNHFIDKGPSNEEDSWTERNVLRVLIAGVLACLLLLLGIYFRYLHGAAPANPSKPAFSDLIQKIGITGVLKASKEELEIACEDFSNIIGSSSHGKLFKGTLANGTEIAVTMVQTSTWSKDSESDFIYEVNRLASIKHKNVVNLLGYCAEDHPLTRMLIFEYVSNGTLFDLLQNCDGQYLDWNARMRIIMGVAYGLEYLHHALLPPTGFCKFGSRSVYLTEDYAAKLAGFEVGKSHLRSKTKVEPVPNEGKRLSVIDRSDGVSNRDDPARSCQNFGADVYSFGVFLVEIISGRPVYSKEQEQGALIDWATGYICSPGLIAQMVDPNLTFLNLNHLEALRDIICRCIDAESRRPTMKAVTSMLETSLGITSEDAYPKHSPLLWAELIIQMQD